MIKDPLLFISQYYRDAALIDLNLYTPLPPASAQAPEQVIQALALTWLSRSTLNTPLNNLERLSKISHLANSHVVFLYELAIESLIDKPSESGLSHALSLLASADLRYKQQIFCAKNIQWIEEATDLTSIYLDFLQKLSPCLLHRPFREICTPEFRRSHAVESAMLLRSLPGHLYLDWTWLAPHRPRPDLSPGGFVTLETTFKIRDLLKERACFSYQETIGTLEEQMIQMEIDGINRQIAAFTRTPRPLAERKKCALDKLAAAKGRISVAQTTQNLVNQSLSDLIQPEALSADSMVISTEGPVR